MNLLLSFYSGITRSCLNLFWRIFLYDYFSVVRSCMNLLIHSLWFFYFLSSRVWTCCQNHSWYSPALSGHVWTCCRNFSYSGFSKSCVNLLPKSLVLQVSFVNFLLEYSLVCVWFSNKIVIPNGLFYPIVAVSLWAISIPHRLISSGISC